MMATVTLMQCSQLFSGRAGDAFEEMRIVIRVIKRGEENCTEERQLEINKTFARLSECLQACMCLFIIPVQ